MNAALQSTATRQADDRERAMIWFGRHLWDQYGVDIYAGLTSTEQREATIRRVILERGIAGKVLGRFNGKPESHAQFCSRALRIDIDIPPGAVMNPPASAAMGAEARNRNMPTRHEALGLSQKGGADLGQVAPRHPQQQGDLL